jgi:hypothetical protein
VRKFWMFSRPVILSLVIFPVAVLATVQEVQADRRDKNGDSERSEKGNDHVKKILNQELAYKFLASQETLQGQLGTIYRNLSTQSIGAKLPFKLSYIMLNPNGVPSRIEFSNMRELERFIYNVRGERDDSAFHIRDRGFRTMMSNYEATVSSECSSEWFNSSSITVQQTDFQIVLRQGEKTFKAATVGNALTVMFPSGQLPPLTGQFNKQGQIDLSDTLATCKIRLTPNKRS